jgi:hypothetical protein
VVDEAALGQVFSFQFLVLLCQYFHQLLSTHHYAPNGAGTKCQIVADLPSEFSLTQPQES